MMRLSYLAATLALAVSIALVPARAGEWRSFEDELDRFAAEFLNSVQPRSFAEKREHCGLFGYDAAGNFAATGPIAGLPDSCDPGLEPEGFEVLASYHTHGAYDIDADSEVPSLDDLRADIDEGIDGYIATPGGRLWLNLAQDQTAYLLCDRGCLLSDPAYRDCQAYMPGEIYTLDGLKRREEDDPGYC